MARRRNKGRSISGVLVLDKIEGMTSNSALQQAKRLFFAAKAGHTGALDPMATGVLPLCFGESTKFSQYLLDADKKYETTIRLGVATSTADAEGEVLSTADASAVSAEQVEHALNHFRGDILQVPPMVSALKYQGQPLYKLARQGIEIEREARAVTIYHCVMLDFRPGDIAEVDIAVHCSKGTYIRSIAHDLGADLGVGGHVSRLHRTMAGAFGIDTAVSLETLTQERGEGLSELLDHHLLPVDAPIEDLPELNVDENTADFFMHGQPVMDMRVYRIGSQGDKVRVRRDDGIFLGVAEITDEGQLAPKRLVVLDQ